MHAKCKPIEGDVLNSHSHENIVKIFLPNPDQQASNFNPETFLTRGEAFNPDLPSPIQKPDTLTLKPPWQGGEAFNPNLPNPVQNCPEAWDFNPKISLTMGEAIRFLIRESGAITLSSTFPHLKL